MYLNLRYTNSLKNLGNFATWHNLEQLKRKMIAKLEMEMEMEKVVTLSRKFQGLLFLFYFYDRQTSLYAQ